VSHTPGPWTWDDSQHFAEDGAIYAGNEYLFGIGDRPDDARLIAAAPDLLVALERIEAIQRHRLEGYHHGFTLNGAEVDVEMAAKLARAAIAKATGAEVSA
jgi:hypothetical protein